MNTRCMRALRGALALLLGTAACSRVDVPLTDLACDDGRCLAGYLCHPVKDVCIAALPVGCDAAGAYCPSRTVAGDPCPWVDAVLPCADDRRDCDQGCRTCGAELSWSQCSPPRCSPELCNNRDDDCDGVRDNGLGPACRCDGGDPLADDVCAPAGVDDDCNALIDDGCCGPGDTFVLGAPPLTCEGGAVNVPLMQLVATSSCANTLQSLTLTRHPASNTSDGGISSILLYHDVDASGSLTAGDVLLAGPTGMTSGVITFDDIGLGVAGGGAARLIVVGSRAGEDSYFAAQILDTSAFTLADNETKELATTPLVSGVHSFAENRCDVAPAGPTDLGAGTQVSPSTRRYVGPNTAAWSSGAGDETTWTAGTPYAASVTADCNLETQGTRGLQTRDRGRQSEYLHIDTGVPLGLPLCRLRMRAYASRYNSGGCSDGLFAQHQRAYLFAYTGARTVSAASLSDQPITASGGPSSPAYGTDWADFDLLPLYGAASGTATLNVRFIPEATNAVDADGATRINSIAEIYILAGP